MLKCQASLAQVVVSSSPFAHNLHKRLAVLQRIYYATAKTYHSPPALLSYNKTLDDYAPDSTPDGDQQVQSGNEALIEIGVQSGLSLLFSLLRQNWQLAASLGTSGLCNDVLVTALGIVKSLPPLTLANESKLTILGIKSLNHTTDFLKSVFHTNVGADSEGKKLCSELMLSLAAQRGSLKSLFQWIELAMLTSATTRDEQENRISWILFKDIITQMMKSAVSCLTIVVLNHGI